MWRSEIKFQELALFFHHVDPRDQIQVNKLAIKFSHPLSHLNIWGFFFETSQVVAQAIQKHQTNIWQFSCLTFEVSEWPVWFTTAGWLIFSHFAFNPCSLNLWCDISYTQHHVLVIHRPISAFPLCLFWKRKPVLFAFIVCLCMMRGLCMCHMYVEARGQIWGVHSLFPPLCGFLGLNSSCQVMRVS